MNHIVLIEGEEKTINNILKDAVEKGTIKTFRFVEVKEYPNEIHNLKNIS